MMIASTYTLIKQIETLQTKSKEEKNFKKRLNQLLNTLIKKVDKKGFDLDDLDDTLLDNILQTRLLLIKTLKKQEASLPSFFQQIPLETNTSSKRRNQIYSKYTSLCLEIMNETITSSLEFESQKIDTTASFTELKEIAQIYPVSNFIIFLKWLECSLKLEVGVLIFELIARGRVLTQSKKAEKRLINSYKNKVEQLGAYAILLGIWSPRNTDRQAIRNMIILSSAYELEFRKSST